MIKQYLNNITASNNGTIEAGKRAQVVESGKALASAYALALCSNPDAMAPHKQEAGHPPVIKPLFKHVVKPGEPIVKDIIAFDPDGGKLTLKVTGLPAKALFDGVQRRITWTPERADSGVYCAIVTASNEHSSTSRPFIIAVTDNARNIPKMPGSLRAELVAGGTGVQLSWTAPDDNSPISYYLIYRDGILWAATPENTLFYTDSELLAPGESTRYAVSAMDAKGAESGAAYPTPQILHIPGR